MFTSDEFKRIGAFCETCESIAGCRFMTEFSKQSHHICVGTLPDGRVMDEYPRHDIEDFRAFLTLYRKLRLGKEPTNLFRIMDILKRKGDPTDRAKLSHFKDEIDVEGKSWWGATLIDQAGVRTLLSQVSLEDLILNGDVFHTDFEKRDALKQVIGKAGISKAVAFLNYMRFVRTVLYCAQNTAELIHHRGYLA